jgi:starch synthase
MSDMYNVLIVAAECIPYAKSGGLGDVVGTLPKYLQKKGCNVTVVIPMYGFIDRKKFNIQPYVEGLEVNMDQEIVICNVLKTNMPGSPDIPVYFIDHKPFFDRPNMYHDDHFNDYGDNPKRFMFLSKAALQLCQAIDFVPDIVHANDWHTAIIPAYIKRLFKDDPFFVNTASVITIHNIAYQGRYHRDFFGYSGLDWSDYTADKFECHLAINLLKGGIQFADMINTVSPGYAKETRSAPGGNGLENFLRNRGENYIGILNGVDYSQWDPQNDKLIPANYSPSDMEGKKICKETLRKELGLEPTDNTPIIGIVSRLVEQKGFHLLAECINGILENMDVQFAILGTGDKRLENIFENLSNEFPGNIASYIGFSNDLAHLIEAGSDLFLMPSIYEPCGLNQIYSLRYGTLPIVRATGGLNDTVENYNQETVQGTGFKFYEPSGRAVYHTIEWAVDTFLNHPGHFQKLIQNAMKQNFTWEDSVKKYLDMYRSAKDKVTKSRNLTPEYSGISV